MRVSERDVRFARCIWSLEKELRNAVHIMYFINSALEIEDETNVISSNLRISERVVCP